MPRGQAQFACGVLVTFALVTVAAGLAAWYKYQLLAGPLAPGPYVDNPLVEVDTYFRNLMGWRTGLLLVALLQFSIWLANMRDLADVIWRQGQRRHRAWLVFGWVIPLGQLFIPKMFINDLWAASRPEPQRRRGHPLLTAWWLSVLVAANAYSDAPHRWCWVWAGAYTCSKWKERMKQSRGWPIANRTQSSTDWAVSGSPAVREA